MDPALRAMLWQTVTIRPFTGYDADADEQYGPPITWSPVRVQEEVKLVRNEAGEEVASSATIYGEPLAVPSGSRVTLPSGAEMPIIRVAQVANEHEIDHTVVYA